LLDVRLGAGEMSQLDRRSGSREARTIPAHETAYAEGLRITIRKADAEIARLRAENDRLRVALEVLVEWHNELGPTMYGGVR
jgi:hypothetical protein